MQRDDPAAPEGSLTPSYALEAMPSRGDRVTLNMDGRPPLYFQVAVVVRLNARDAKTDMYARIVEPPDERGDFVVEVI